MTKYCSANLVVVTGVQLRAIFVLITTWSARKYSTGARLFVELNCMLTLGAWQGASVTIIVTSSTVAIKVTLFLALAFTLNNPRSL